MSLRIELDYDVHDIRICGGEGPVISTGVSPTREIGQLIYEVLNAVAHITEDVELAVVEEGRTDVIETW